MGASSLDMAGAEQDTAAAPGLWGIPGGFGRGCGEPHKRGRPRRWVHSGVRGEQPVLAQGWRGRCKPQPRSHSEGLAAALHPRLIFRGAARKPRFLYFLKADDGCCFTLLVPCV